MAEQEDFSKEQYRQEMQKVSEAALGLEMTNHVKACADCTKILLEANQKVLLHMEQVNNLR